MIERVRDFFHSHSEFFDPRPEIGEFLVELGNTPESRTMPPLHPPNLKKAYAEIATLQVRVRVLERALREAGIELPYRAVQKDGTDVCVAC